MKTIDYATVVAFLIGVLWLGSRFYKWIGAPDDFYLAGRQLTPFILAASMTTANISLFSLIGVSGTAYQSGISIIWLTWTGNMALVFSGLYVIPFLRRLRIRTIPEFLEMRYGPGVRSLVGVLWIFRLTFWISVVLYAGVIAAQQLTGIHSFALWLMVFSFIVIVYTTAGGMWSIVLTNNLGFLLVMVSVLTVLPIAMKAVGWWPGLASGSPASGAFTVRAALWQVQLEVYPGDFAVGVAMGIVGPRAAAIGVFCPRPASRFEGNGHIRSYDHPFRFLVDHAWSCCQGTLPWTAER